MIGLVFKKRSGIPLCQTVIAHTKDGRGIVGVLVGSYEDSFVLKHAATVPEGDKFVGDVVIPRDNVGFFQANVPDHLLPRDE